MDWYDEEDVIDEKEDNTTDSLSKFGGFVCSRELLSQRKHDIKQQDVPKSKKLRMK